VSYASGGCHGEVPRRSTLAIDILKLSAPQDSRDSQWLAMRLALWPEASSADHLLGMADAVACNHFVRLARDVSGLAWGFVGASKRVDYVNGTDTSPVAFLEGIYVVPEFRRHGVARSLVAAVVNWATGEQCRELASDSLLPNTEAHAANRSLGFDETERVVYFRMALPDG
jgi:aminoglycoside 6'-N-acetyltransferase I